MIVLKFGGTSVGSAEAIERVADIVAGRVAERPLVVVSAMGKTTDRLLELATTAVEGDRKRVVELLGDLRDFHGREARKLVPPARRAPLETCLEEHFQELSELVKGLSVLGELTPRATDATASYGERLSSLVVSQAFEHRGLSAALLDSRRYIVTDQRHTQATPLFEPTEERLRQVVPELLAEGRIPVMGGYIAATEQGVTTTLGRGGSDFTASLVGAALGAFSHRRMSLKTGVGAFCVAGAPFWFFGFDLGTGESSSELWECGNRGAISKGGGKRGKPGFGFPRFPPSGISTTLFLLFSMASWRA